MLSEGSGGSKRRHIGGSVKLENWEDISDWYDKKQGETGDFWHRALIDPALLRIIGNCRDKEILDLGCGIR
jgi:ubiquinone/menaquinone biosynthesis C-methylase UbiE